MFSNFKNHKNCFNNEKFLDFCKKTTLLIIKLIRMRLIYT